MKRLAVLMMTGALIVGSFSLAGCGSANTPDSGTKGKSDFDASQLISVVSREDGSGTRGAFIELFGVEQEENGEKIDNTTQEAIITNSTEIMMTSVAGDPFAIGYASLGAVNDSIKLLNVEGAEPTVENIKSGTYKISRPFHIATKEGLSDVSQDFVNYILSADGQKVIEDSGYISVSEAEDFVSNNAKGKIVLAGSSSVSPVMEKLKEAYLAVNTKAEVEIQESDSTTGMAAAVDGTCDIGMASRALKDSEIRAGLTGTEIALDGIAVIINKRNPMTDITAENVRNIFTGTYTTWDEVK